jgi:hypothetical protein
MWKGDYEIVTVLLVHGGHDMVEFHVDGSVIPHPPVEEGIGAGSAAGKLCWAAGCHDPRTWR